MFSTHPKPRYFNKYILSLPTLSLFLLFLFIQSVDASDEVFWSQFWSESITNIQDVFTLIPAAEIRVLREECPSNLATLYYKALKGLVHAADSSCATQQEHSTGQMLNTIPSSVL